MTQVHETMLQVGRYRIPSKIEKRGDRLFIFSPYNADLIEIIKSLEGRKWHGFEDPPIKAWSIADSAHNRFQLRDLMGCNPYAPWDREYIEFTPSRPLYSHQLDMVRHWLTVHYGIWAVEMGAGKTLAAIEGMEATGEHDWWWVAPRSALYAVQMEFRKWGCQILPQFMTYEGLRKRIQNWKQGAKAPRGVVFDESSRIKSPTALRTQAARQLADGIRVDHGDDGYVLLMTGTPAPKSPADWWAPCETACPGFLREGNIHSFQQRLGIYEKREQPQTGGMYMHKVAWLDDEKRCAICGLYENAHHVGTEHVYKPSVNEVAKLYRRMKGLVIVKFKKDCLDLPEKQYKIIRIKPTLEMQQVSSAILETARNASAGRALVRELSDGFQYTEKVVGKKECGLCQGTKTIKDMDSGLEVLCDRCGGSGEQDVKERITEYVDKSKAQVLESLLDEHNDVGRVVIYAGFTGSVDICAELCQKLGWHVLRVDGRGWHIMSGANQAYTPDRDDVLDAMDGSSKRKKELTEKYPKVAFVGHPGSGGMGLTLTSSPSVIYYSNDFLAENRMQSEDRIHRAGMDENRGATIIDIVHLDTDLNTLKNLKEKRDLQNMSMGELKAQVTMDGIVDFERER